MGSIFLLLKSPVLLYWMYNAIHFTLLGGGICCIPLKNVVLCSSMYLSRQSLILLSLRLNFVRPGPEQSLAQSSFTLTVTRPLLRTAWSPVYCEVFCTGAFCELRITAYCPMEALPNPTGLPILIHTQTPIPFPSLELPLGAAPVSWVSAPWNKTSRSRKPIIISCARWDSWALPGFSLPDCSPDTLLGRNRERLWASLRLFHWLLSPV